MPQGWVEFSLTKSKKVVLCNSHSSSLSSLIPFFLFSLPLSQAKHYLSLLSVCLWLRKNFSIAVVHLGIEVEVLNFPLLHVPLTKPIVYIVTWCSVSTHNWLQSTQGNQSTAWLTLMSNKSLDPGEHQLSGKKYILELLCGQSGEFEWQMLLLYKK